MTNASKYQSVPAIAARHMRDVGWIVPLRAVELATIRASTCDRPAAAADAIEQAFDEYAVPPAVVGVLGVDRIAMNCVEGRSPSYG